MSKMNTLEGRFNLSATTQQVQARTQLGAFVGNFYSVDVLAQKQE